MPLMVLMMVPITWDWFVHASMPFTASCIWVARARITSTVCCATAAPLRAVSSVCREVSKATLAASDTACSAGPDR